MGFSLLMDDSEFAASPSSVDNPPIVVCVIDIRLSNRPSCRQTQRLVDDIVVACIEEGRLGKKKDKVGSTFLA